MAATLRSRLGGDVNLPHDLLPDDTTLIYDPSGKAVEEVDFDDPEDEEMAELKQRERCISLALTDYNKRNVGETELKYSQSLVPPTSFTLWVWAIYFSSYFGPCFCMQHTDYKRVIFERSRFCFHSKCAKKKNRRIIHCGFTAVPSTCTPIDYESSAKYFIAELQAKSLYGDVVLTSCRILNVDETMTGCDMCDLTMIKAYDKSEWGMEANVEAEAEADHVNYVKDKEDQILSRYSYLLADGVTLSERAMLRLPFPFLALEYYNNEHCTNYKLVDALPSSGFADSFMVHCNFIARQSEPADDVANKLFFAEVDKPLGEDWVVTDCRLLHVVASGEIRWVFVAFVEEYVFSSCKL